MSEHAKYLKRYECVKSELVTMGEPVRDQIFEIFGEDLGMQNDWIASARIVKRTDACLLFTLYLSAIWLQANPLSAKGERA